jgi:hypothetical protein
LQVLLVARRYSSAWWRIACTGVAVAVCLLWTGGLARADGAMVLGRRTLFQTGPAEPHYCETEGDECDSVLAKFLSSYGFLRGALRGGLATTWPNDSARVAAFGSLHLDAASAALPGGDMAVGSVDAVLARDQMLRLRVTVANLENVFFCDDAQSGAKVFPFVGMVTRQCRPNAWLGLDLRLLRLQWDTSGNLTEWLRAGPAFELLGNGLGQAHLLRSLVVGVPLDVQSRLSGSAPHGTSLGLGLRLSALYRTPQWESRLQARHRTALFSRGGFAREHSLDAELRVLRNWFAHDALVMQTGVALSLDWASQDWAGQSLWTSRGTRFGFQASFYLGWVNEAPAI